MSCSGGLECGGLHGTFCVADCDFGSICVTGQKYSHNVFCNLFAAMSCNSGADCFAACVADYCQPGTCTATGQCVHGQKCSQNAASRTCVCKPFLFHANFYRVRFSSLKIPFTPKIIIIHVALPANRDYRQSRD